MSFVKVLAINNFQEKFVVTKEDAGTFSCLSTDGEFIQISKGKGEIDSVIEYREDEFYRYESCQKLKNIVLRQRVEDEKDSLSKFLGLNLIQMNQPHAYTCSKTNTLVQFYYSIFNPKSESCVVEFFENSLNLGKEQLREVIVLVLEEFGTYYLDGQKLREYLSVKKAEKRKGKNFWSLTIDYKNLISIPGYKSFQFYSDDMSFTRNFSHQEHNNNIVDFGAIRKVHEMQRDLNRRSKGFALKKSA